MVTARSVQPITAERFRELGLCVRYAPVSAGKTTILEQFDMARNNRAPPPA
jgi:hypothetical protein